MAKVTFPYRGTTFDVIKTGIGFTNVNNTSDLAKPLSIATKEALRGKQDSWSLGALAFRNTINYKELVGKPTTLTDIGITDTFATLVNGTVPSAQLPSYVDDILEFTTLTALQSATIADGAKATGKIYITTDTGKIYRWGGSQYVDISSKVDSVNGKTGAITLVASDIGLGNVSNTSDIEKPISTATQTALNNKVTIVNGKVLSTNDYTDIDKNKVNSSVPAWMLGALAFRNTINYSELKEIPTVFKPDTHSHAIADVTLLQETLNKKVDTIAGKGLSSNDYSSSEKSKLAELPNWWAFGALAFRNTVNYSELLDKPTLGSLASKSSVTLSDISGLTGTASGTTYLKGDGTWSPIALPTYTIASGAANGTISLTNSSGSTTTASVTGLGSAAYTNSSSYLTPADITGFKVNLWMLGALAYRNTVSYSEVLDKPDVFGLTTALTKKVDVLPGKSLSSNDYTDIDKTKVSSIAPNWMLGALAFRDRISFKELLDTQSTLNGYGITDGINISAIGNTIPSLVNGTIPSSQLPSYVDDVLEFSSMSALQSANLASGAQSVGKIYITIDTGRMYRWSGSTYIDISSKVDSVSGRTGVITLGKSDVGLTNVDNTSDLTKPLSDASKTALATKVDIVSGKVLSSNDYTSVEKSKLANLPNGWSFGALAFRNTINYSELLDKPTFGSLASKNSVTLTDVTGISGTASDTTYLRGDGSWASIILPGKATTTTNGIVKLGSDTVQTIGAASPSAVTGKTYPIQVDSVNNGMVVNVPWTDTVPTLSTGSVVKSFSVTVNGSTSSIPVYGIDNVDNTSDANKPISLATKAALTDKTSTWMLGALAFRNTVSYSELVGTLPTHGHSTTSITDWDKLPAITSNNIYLDTSGTAAPYLRGSTDSSSIVIAGGKGWTDRGAIIQLFGKDSPVDINSKSTKNGINIFGGGTSALGTQGQCIIDNFTKVGINTTSPSEVLSVNGSVIAKGYKTTSGTSSGFLKADGTIDMSSYLTSATASTTVAGIVKLGSDAVQVTSANAVSSDSGRTYAVQLDSINSRMVVNVPWVDTNTDTNTTYTFAEGTTNGAFNVTPSTTTTATPVTVHGLGTAAYTASSDYASSFHSHSGYATISSGSVASSSLLLGDGTMKLLQAPFADISNLSNIKDPYLIRNKCLGGAGEWLSVVANNSSTLELGPVIANTASNSTATNLKLKPNTRINGVSITLKQSDAAMDANYVVQGSDNNLPGWDISLYGNFQKSVGIDNTLKFTAWSVPYYYNATTNKLSNKDSTGNLVTDNWYSGSSNPTFYIHEDGRIALYGNLSAVTGSNPDKSKSFKSQWPPKYGFICITSGGSKITEVPYGANQEYGSLIGTPLYFDRGNKRLYMFDTSDTDATHPYGTWYYITATRDTATTTGDPFSK